MRHPTEDDYIGMAPCHQCDTFPELEPWFVSFDDPNVLVHLSGSTEWHKMTRTRFNQYRKTGQYSKEKA